MKKNIFSKNEVLISCSSLKNLYDYNLLVDSIPSNVYYHGNLSLIELIARNISAGIHQKAKKIAELEKNKTVNADVAQLVVNIFLNRRYRRGDRNGKESVFYNKCKNRIQKRLPIEFTISLFPCKIPNVLKTDGPLPDLAELLSLGRLIEICLAIREIYQPGANIIVLMDGFRFKDICYFEKSVISNYQDRLKKLLSLLDDNNCVILNDYMIFLDELSHSDRQSIKEKKEDFYKLYSAAIGPYVQSIILRKNIDIIKSCLHGDVKKVVDLFNSLVYSINFQRFIRHKSDKIVKLIYLDPWDFVHCSLEIGQLRKELLQKAWQSTLHYISEIAAGRTIKPVEIIFPESIRCDMHMIPDRYTFYSVDRSTTLTAFHGTGYINEFGKMGVKFRVQLKTDRFVPLYIHDSKYSYTNQAFCYVPSGIKEENNGLKDFLTKTLIR